MERNSTLTTLSPQILEQFAAKLHKIITLQLRRTKASPGKPPRFIVCSTTSSRGTASAARPLSTGLQPFNHLLSLLLTSHWHYSLTELLTPSAEELGVLRVLRKQKTSTNAPGRMLANPWSLTLGLFKGAYKHALTLLSVRSTFHRASSILSYQGNTQRSDNYL